MDVINIIVSIVTVGFAMWLVTAYQQAITQIKNGFWQQNSSRTVFS
jgi:hypothetical protein